MLKISFFLLFLSAAFSGCLHDTTPPSTTRLTVEGGGCTELLISGCDDGAGVLSLTAKGATISEVIIRNLTKPLILQDLHLVGDGPLVSVDGGCQTCTVTLRKASIQAGQIGVRIGSEAPLLAPLRIEHSRFVSLGPAGPQGPDAIVLEATLGSVEVVNVTFSGTGQAAILGRSSGSLTLRDVAIDGHDFGIIGTWNALTLHGVQIDCVIEGIRDYHAKTVALEDVSVESCKPDCEFFCPAIALGAINNAAERFDIVDLRITGSQDGLAFSGVKEASMVGFDLSDNLGMGAVLLADILNVRDGVAANNDGGLDLAGYVSVTVRNVGILDNGLDDGDPTSDFGMRILQVEGGTYVIRDSSFVGNRVWGFMAGNLDEVVDASGNWWGSPLGPSVGTPEILGNPPVPGFGDLVYGPVITEPHLTSPP